MDVFPGVETSDLLIVPTCQRSDLDLVQTGEKIDTEKDRLLERVRRGMVTIMLVQKCIVPASAMTRGGLKACSSAELRLVPGSHEQTGCTCCHVAGMDLYTCPKPFLWLPCCAVRGVVQGCVCQAHSTGPLGRLHRPLLRPAGELQPAGLPARPCWPHQAPAARRPQTSAGLPWQCSGQDMQCSMPPVYPFQVLLQCCHGSGQLGPGC